MLAAAKRMWEDERALGSPIETNPTAQDGPVTNYKKKLRALLQRNKAATAGAAGVDYMGAATSALNVDAPITPPPRCHLALALVGAGMTTVVPAPTILSPSVPPSPMSLSPSLSLTLSFRFAPDLGRLCRAQQATPLLRRWRR